MESNLQTHEKKIHSITDDTQFYLNADNQLVICFSKGDVGPMSMGCISFTIPDDVLSDIRR